MNLTKKEKEILLEIFSVLEDVREVRQCEIYDRESWLKDIENQQKKETKSEINYQKKELLKVEKGISLIKKIYINANKNPTPPTTHQ